MKKMLLPLVTGALVVTVLAGCSQAEVKKMPTAAPSPSYSASKAPSDLLPKNDAKQVKGVKLATVTLAKGVDVQVYKVGEGAVVAQQIKANPQLAENGVKAGDKLVVLRYLVTNKSGKTVPVASFTYNGVFVGGSGKAASQDNGYASAAARLGLTPTPINDFTDAKGKAGNWALANGKSATWYSDWVLENKGVLQQNFVLNKQLVSNIKLDLAR